MDLIKKIEEIVADGWQVQSVWIVPPVSHASKPRSLWEAQIKIADFVPGGEGDGDLQITVDRSEIPEGVQIREREKVGDQVIDLPPMSDEQAEAMADALHRAGDASATHKTSSGCWSIGPTAYWCKDPLRSAILKSRKK